MRKILFLGSEVHKGLFNLHKAYYIEVIGNVTDNPELLEGEE